MELLKELCETAGIPGREERLRAIVRRELESIVDEFQVDALGNLIGVKKKAGAKKLMIAAHMDEIGFVVSHIDDEKGWLRVVALGGHDPRNMVAQCVIVCTDDGDLPGILYPGIRPPHIQTEEDRKKELRISDFFVDLGLPASTVKERVRLGTPVAIQRDFQAIGECASCKAMDNRLALYIMIRAMQQAEQFGFETYAVATTQEEIGLRGAATSAFGINPDVGIAIDVTVAADIPGVPEHERVTQLGEGTAIKILDSSSISHPRLVTFLQKLAGRRGIKWQPEILPQGGTDAGAMQLIRAGVPVATISTPTRYIHTSVEMCNQSDIQASVDLLAAFIEEGDAADLVLT
jgi:endoglucanase